VKRAGPRSLMKVSVPSDDRVNTMSSKDAASECISPRSPLAPPARSLPEEGRVQRVRALSAAADAPARRSAYRSIVLSPMRA